MKGCIKDAMLIFTDVSFNGRAAYIVNGIDYVTQTAPASAQRVEILAVAMIFQVLVKNSLNLYTDSRYIFRAFQAI